MSSHLRRLCLVLLCGLSCGLSALAFAGDLQSTLDRHLRADVAYWLQEPRLTALLRDANQAAPTDDEIAALAARWREELAGDGGELSDRIASRFVSKYLAEVALRLDGAYGPLVVLDNRNMVVAASELPDELLLGDDRCVRMLAARADAAWVQDRKPATGAFTRIARPLFDADGSRIGTLLLDIDVSRLPAGSIAGEDTRRRDDTAISAHSVTLDDAVVR